MTDKPSMVRPLKGRAATPLGVVGDAAALAAAYRDGAPVVIGGGRCDGDTVYLGHTAMVYDGGADAVVAKTTGLHHVWTHAQLGEIAEYYIDETRLDQAPKTAEALAQIRGRAVRRLMAADERIAAEDARIAALDQEG